MTDLDLLKKVKSRGYWKIRLIPSDFNKENLKEFSELVDIMDKSSVKLRGWPYPYFSRDKIKTNQDYIEEEVDFDYSKEIWRFYQSGQYIHFKALKIDWIKENKWISGAIKEIQPGTVLPIENTIYDITEFFEFFSRISKFDIYKNGINLEISLNNTKDRELIILDPLRASLFQQYLCSVESIFYERNISQKEIIELTQDFSLKTIKHFFERFGWLNPPLEVFRNDQDKFLKKDI